MAGWAGASGTDLQQGGYCVNIFSESVGGVICVFTDTGGTVGCCLMIAILTRHLHGMLLYRTAGCTVGSLTERTRPCLIYNAQIINK